MNVNTYGHISNRVGSRISRELLKEMQPELLTQRFGRAPENVPMNGGRTVIWRRYHNLPPATAPLIEGVTPEGQRVTYTDISGYLQEYGDVVVITNVIADTHEDPLLQEMKSKCADQAAQTIELVTIEVLKSGSQVLFANSVAARTNIVTGVARSDLRKAVRALRRAMAKPIGRIISASPDTATRPVEKSYYAMAHTDLEADLRDVPGFTLVVEYGSSAQAVECEFGAVENIRFCTSQNFTPWLAAGGTVSAYLSNGITPATTAAADVYPIIIVAEDAYGVMRLQGKGTAKVTVINPEPNAADPLGQRGYVGWHTWFAAVILNDLYMVRYEVACKANP